MARITIIGCGHVGLVVAAGLAALEHDVIGLDVDELLVHRLRNGHVDIHEPGLELLVAQGIASERLAFTTSYEIAVPDAQFIFLCVDTPQTIGGAADLASIRRAVRSIAEWLDGEDPIIVNKSTSPIGTGETVDELLAVLIDGHRPRIVSNPEFLRQGHALEDFWHPDRIIVGSLDRADALAVARLYDGLDCQALVVTDLRTAELTKYVANAFLAVRVSFINEMARLCDAVGADVDTIVEGVSGDDRIGGAMFVPGIGYGGSCLPKDVAALRYTGESVGVATPLLAATEEVNRVALTNVVRILRSRLGSLEGRRIGVWGLTFKGGTEDVRTSPAMDVVALLVNEGAGVVAFDPAYSEQIHAVSELRRTSPLARRIAIVEHALAACDDSDALVVLTDWGSFREVAVGDIAARLVHPFVVDGRNVLDRELIESAGLTYVGIGRGRRAAELVTA